MLKMPYSVGLSFAAPFKAAELSVRLVLGGRCFRVVMVRFWAFPPPIYIVSGSKTGLILLISRSTLQDHQ